MKYFTSIVICFLIVLIIYVHYNIIEGLGGPQLPSGSNQAQINTTEDLRTFLEQMYMICLLNPNDQSTDKSYNTVCYKMTVLASYLWPVLGPYTYLSLDELSPIFGAPTKPKSIVEKTSDQQNPNPPPIPIITNDLDYQLLLQLAIIGNIIQPFLTEPHNNWNSSVVWFKQDWKKNTVRTRDACYERWGGYQGPVAVNTAYFNEIKTILAYFHSQTDSSDKIYYGDNGYTKMY
jgi:hypothetical protein